MSRQIRKGRNTIKIIVANSGANWQAQGDPIYPAGSWGRDIKSQRDLLPSIDPNGLVGPVRISILRERPLNESKPR